MSTSTGAARRRVVTVDPGRRLRSERRRFEQRQVGVDTRSYVRGLRAPCARCRPRRCGPRRHRHRPVRRRAGNLVISTSGAPTAHHAAIIDSSPPRQQSQVRSPLRSSLRRGLAAAAAAGRRARAASPRARCCSSTRRSTSLIRRGQVRQVPNAIATGGREDMVSLDDSLGDLVDRAPGRFEPPYPLLRGRGQAPRRLQKRYYRLTRPGPGLRGPDAACRSASRRGVSASCSSSAAGSPPDQLADALLARSDPRERARAGRCAARRAQGARRRRAARAAVLARRGRRPRLAQRTRGGPARPRRLAPAGHAARARRATTRSTWRSATRSRPSSRSTTCARSAGCTLRVSLARPAEVREAIEQLLPGVRASENLGEILDELDLSATTEEDVTWTCPAPAGRARGRRLVDLMLAEAIDARASEGSSTSSRCATASSCAAAVNGALHEVMKPPKNLQMAIVSRIKVLADLDIAVRCCAAAPGPAHLPDREVDIRVSTPCPRLRRKMHAPCSTRPSPADRGSSDWRAARSRGFRRAVRLPYGADHRLPARPAAARPRRSTRRWADPDRLEEPGTGRGPDQVPHRVHLDRARQPRGRHDLRARPRWSSPDPERRHRRRDPRRRDRRRRRQSALTAALVLSSVHADDARTVTRLDRHRPCPAAWSARPWRCVNRLRLVRRVCRLALQGELPRRPRAARPARRRRRALLAAAPVARTAASPASRSGYLSRTTLSRGARGDARPAPARAGRAQRGPGSSSAP